MTLARRFADSPPMVLVVSDDGAEDPLVGALADVDDYRVRTATGAREALSAADESTWCVLARSAIGADDDAQLVEAFAERHPTTPVLVVGSGDEIDASARTVVGAGGRFLPVGPEDADLDVLRDAVSTALAEGERRRSDQQYRSALQQFFDGCDEMGFLKDDEGRYLYANDYSGGPDPATMLGKTDAELARDRGADIDDMHHRHELAMEVVETNASIRHRIEQYGEEENAFWFSHTFVPWRDDDGDPVGVVGQTREVSERKSRERGLERQVDRLEQFTNFVSHDLRSPLQLMQGYLELARAGDDEAFDHLVAASKRMEELIEDLEELAGDDDSTIELDRSVDLVPVARQIWQFLGTGDATLEVELPEATTLSGAESELRPLLENLFRNAIVHGGDDVTVWLGALDDGFYVEDDGPGIPPEDRDEVFAEGYTTSEDGTGTGLAIVMDVVGAHSWDVEIVEGRTGGARFEIRNCMLATEPEHDVVLGDAHEIEANADFGTIRTAGSTVQDEATGAWTVRGAGDDLYRDANDFQFAYGAVEGPVRIEAHVTDIEPVNPFSKAGVMVRAGLDDDASHGYVGRTVDRGPEVSWRPESGALSATQQRRARTDRASWVRLDREGDRITASIAEHGDDWEVVDQRHVALSEPVYVGLAVCSVVPRALCTATFEDVSIRSIDAVAD